MSEIKLWPIGCITSPVLYTLINALEKLSTWHNKFGGEKRDEPCLRQLTYNDEDQLQATITCGDVSWNLIYKQNYWTFVGRELK